MMLIAHAPISRALLVVLFMFALSPLSATRALAADPSNEKKPPTAVSLIYDTDICGDCDDVLALGMIHALETRGACRLLAVTVSVDNDLAADFVDAINHFYGRPRIPIGVVGQGGVRAESKFLSLAAQRDGDKLRYRRDLGSSGDRRPANEVLRKTLAGEPDGSVTIVQVGFSTNLARLLDSPADDISPLSGEELVRKKVKLLSLMAGAFVPIDGNSRYREYNVVQDVKSAQTVARRWPTPMVWSGFEIGIALPYPAVSIERDYAYVPHHPLAEAYILYNPPPHARPTWDLTSVLFAVYADRGFFELSPPGTVTIETDGSSPFAADAAGQHRYLVLPADRRARVTEALVQLCSQPPCHD
ncbi:MAG TPA: nucleoside hydrolase [Pirellulales bacterium]|nr:nucleoside hydrolase [Pirellulales bacterium]